MINFGAALFYILVFSIKIYRHYFWKRSESASAVVAVTATFAKNRFWLSKIMGKKPAFLFYPNDWNRDMEEHPLEIQGAWIVLLTKLWWSETRGEATKTLDEWSRILRETRRKTSKILSFFEQKHVADIKGLLNQNGNQSITIKSRRMVNDHYISFIRGECGKKGGNPDLMKNKTNLDKQTVKQNPTLPVPVPIPVPYPTTKNKKEAVISGKRKRKKSVDPILTDDQKTEIINHYLSLLGGSSSDDSLKNKQTRLDGFAKRYIGDGRDKQNLFKDCIDLITSIRDTWAADIPKGFNVLFQYGTQRGGDNQFLKRMEGLENWRNKEYKLADGTAPPTVYACSRPGCGVETENPWHVSGETVYCSQKCKEEAKG